MSGGAWSSTLRERLRPDVPPPLVRALDAAATHPFEALAVVVAAVLGLLVTKVWWVPIALVIAAAVGMASLQRPVWLIHVLFASILLESVSTIDVAVAGIPMTTSKLAALGLAAMWVTHAVYHRKVLLKRLPISTGLIAVVTTMVLSTYTAEYLLAGESVLPIVGVVTLGVVAHLMGTVAQPADLRMLIRGMSVVTVGVLLWQLVAGERIDTSYEVRYSGTFNDPNMWCATLTLIAPLSTASLVRERSSLWIPVLLVLSALYPLNVLQSLSRAGLLTLVMVAPVLVFLVWPRRNWFFLAALALPFLVPLSVDFDVMYDRYATLWDPTMTEVDGSLQTRGALAETGLRLFKLHWLTGVGAGMFRIEAIHLTSGAVFQVAHNTYLTIAVEQGLIGLLSHGLLGWQVGSHLYRCVTQARTPGLRRIAWGYAVSMVGFATIAVTLNLVTFAMAWFILGIGMIIERASELSPEELERIDLA